MPRWVQEQGLGHIVIVVDVDVVDACAQGRFDHRHSTAVEGADSVEHQVHAVEQRVQAGRVEHIGLDGAYAWTQLRGEFLGGGLVEIANHTVQFRVTSNQLTGDIRADVAAA
ncbi:hypothetical protein D3C80_1579910 [compost metagenome]